MLPASQILYPWTMVWDSMVRTIFVPLPVQPFEPSEPGYVKLKRYVERLFAPTAVQG